MTESEPARLLTAFHLEQGRWSQAISAARMWKDRTDADALPADLAIARAQIGLKQFDAAQASLKPYFAAAQADPERRVDVLMLHAAALAAGGRVQPASDLLLPLASKYPAFRRAWMVIATDYLDGPAAGSWLDRLDPIIAQAEIPQRVAFAESCDRVGRRTNNADLVQRATAMLTQLSSAPDASAVALFAAAMQAERNGDSAAAESLHRRALKLDGNLAAAANNLAMLIANRGGDLKEAIGLANAAVKLQPNSASIHDTLAYLQSKSGDHRAAVECMRIAVRLEPGNAKWRVRLAQYLLDGGQGDDAARVIRAIDSGKLGLTGLPAAVREQLERLRKQLANTSAPGLPPQGA